jgi:hypothetical protein
LSEEGILSTTLKQFSPLEKKRLRKFTKEMRTIQALEPKFTKHDCGVGKAGPVLKPS